MADDKSLRELIQASESLPFGFLVYKNNGEICAFNEALYRMCGCISRQEFSAYTHDSYADLIDTDHADESQLCVRLRTKEHTSVSCYCIKQTIADAMVLYLHAYDEDHDQNVFDSVSGLYQKEYLFNLIQEQLKDSNSVLYANSWHMIFINISGFRAFNDDSGYTEGNRLLHACSQLMREVFQTRNITRVYADQFAVLYCGNDVEEKVNQLHKRALALRSDFSVWLRAGIYHIEKWNEPLDVILDYARTACGMLKRTGKYCCVYSRELKDELDKKKYIISHADEAIEKGWLVLYFQPVIRTLSGKICSGEALARWMDPVYGMIPPGEFVPVLEESRLSYKLARFVIDRAAGYISEAGRMGMYPIPVSINLSRRDFDEMDPFDEVEKAVKKYGISRNLLCIEITESTVMDNPEKIRRYINRFHEAGYEVWMDDFGSAYSSLNVLKDFAFDEIKLDMAFMRNFNERAKNIIASCINMAKDLGIHTLCEGVETKEQADFLLEHGCEKIQGFYYSKPQPVSYLKNQIDKGVFSFELSVERFLYDEAGRIKMDPKRAEAVLLCDRKVVYPLEISRRLQDGIKRAGITTIELRKPLDIEETDFWQKLKVVLQNCKETGKKEEVSYFLDGRYYVLSAHEAAESNAGSICSIEMRDITESAKGLVLADAGSLAQTLAGIYDCIYRIDPDEKEIQVVLSDFSGEASGRKFAFDGEEMSAFIYWKDRERFKEWIDLKHIRKILGNKEKVSSDLFRIEKPDGTRVWELFTLIRSTDRDENEVILCMRPSAASHMETADNTAEKASLISSSAMAENGGIRVGASLWNSLMEQGILKVFWKDRKRRFIGASESFLDYFGMTSEAEILGKKLEECPWIKEGRDDRNVEEEVLNNGKVTGWLPSKAIVNGTVHDTAVLKFPFYKDGVIAGLAGVFVDKDDLHDAGAQKSGEPFIDPKTGVMNYAGWLLEISEYEDDYSRLEKDYAVGVLVISSYWKTYHEFGSKTAEQMAKIAAETIRSEAYEGCMIGRVDKETFVIAAQDADEDMKRLLENISSLLSEMHYIGAYSGMISSYSAYSDRSETNNPLRTISLALERAEKAVKEKTWRNERSPVGNGTDEQLPADSIVTHAQIEERIKVLLHSFDFVRLADPENQKVLRYDRSGRRRPQQGNCFDIWQTGQPCENCISLRTLHTKEKLTKFETDGENVFIVISQYMEVDERPCVLEMVARMNDSSSLGSDERGIFIRTLANCRAKMYEDTLTGLHNRRYYEDLLAEHKVEAAALIDIDDLKKVNETYGHLAGDAVIRRTAEAVSSCVHFNDLVRFEGDRFLIGFRKITQMELRTVLNEIEKRISKIHLDIYPELHVSGSIGAAMGHTQMKHLIGRADDALRIAQKKHSRIVIDET